MQVLYDSKIHRESDGNSRKKLKIGVKNTFNKTNIFEEKKNRRLTKSKCRMFHKFGGRIQKVPEGNLNISSFKYLLRNDFETCRKWVVFQMCTDMNWNKDHIDHVESIASFDISEDGVEKNLSIGEHITIFKKTQSPMR